MNSFYISNPTANLPRKSQSSTIDLIENIQVQPAKHKTLSMIWVKEFDGKDYRLTAKWVSNHD